MKGTTMAEYVDIEQAKGMSGLRVILPPGRPNPWAEAFKGVCYVKKIPIVQVRKAQGHDAALQAWTAQASAPVAIWNDERPRSTWIEQLYLAERLTPQPALMPTDIEDRALMFGYCNELCGENGFGWSRRIMVLHPTLVNPQSDEAARDFASYLGGKYGYDQSTAEAAPTRIAQILRLLGTRLEQQRMKGSRFFIGTQLSALDIYWATFAVLIKPLPPELCPIPEQLRTFFTNTDPTVAAAVTPLLMEHQDFIYREFLELPMDL
jgi:glutathione S-transferase